MSYFIPHPSIYLKINLDAQDRINIEAARKKAASLTSSVSLSCLNFDSFGADVCKRLKCSPDAFLQVAYQRAYKLLGGVEGSTYEACSMKHFHHGRTEVIRSFTREAKTFASLRDLSDKVNTERTFREAVAKHVQFAAMCRSGQVRMSL